MAFPETPHMESDEVEFYQRQLRERIVAGHRKLNTAMVDADTNSFTSQLRQLEALRDLSIRLENRGETLGGKLLLLIHGYYGVPLHPRHRCLWQRNIEEAVEGWFEPP